MLNTSTPVRVHTHWLWRGATWAGTAFFLFLAWVTWTSTTGSRAIAYLFIVFALLCAYEIILTSTVVEVDGQSVTLRNLLAKYQIQWSEVQSIESNGLTFALLGADKRLVFNLAMSGKGRPEFSAALERIVKGRHIKVQGLTSIYLTQKNVRVH